MTVKISEKFAIFALTVEAGSDSSQQFNRAGKNLEKNPRTPAVESCGSDMLKFISPAASCVEGYRVGERVKLDEVILKENNLCLEKTY